MSPVGRLGDSCSCGCKRPAREIAGLSTSCWMALTTGERALLTWAHESQQTQPVDVLELWYQIPAYDRDRRDAA